jgi:serine/threonine protein kinase
VTSSDGDTTGEGTDAPLAFAVGDLVAKRYKVVRVVGSGSTGEVYEALDTALGGAVALKTLKPAFSSHAVERERFRREIQSARKVTHPNVCRIFDLGIEEMGKQQRIFLTMELLSGQSLAQRLSKAEPYSYAEALPVISQLANGLQAAHDSGVVHRDLKPGNIMLLEPSPGRGAARAVITDFGLALSDDQTGIRLTESADLVGTPEYMAPEQGDVGKVTPAADIYALGLIVYEMLTKRRPFDSEPTPMANILKRRNQPPRSLRALLPDVDPVWDATVARCLQRVPEARFPRATDVVAALEGRIAPMPEPPKKGGLSRLAGKLGKR